MKLIRRCVLWLVTALSAASVLPLFASAETYPSRVVTMLVPFPAGGPVDTLARILAESMRKSIGQPVIIGNVAGAGGSIGVGRAARSKPDGYTLSIGDWTSHVASGAIYPVQYNLMTDFEPVSLLSTSPQVIVGKSALSAKNLNELIAWLKANPDKATAATVGLGSNPHLCGITFQKRTGTHFEFVPYRGGAPAIQAVVAGQVDFMCAEASQTLAHVRSGSLKAYAVLSKDHWSALPEVPTIDEAGLPDFYIVQWRGLWVPKDTPKDVIAKLQTAVTDALTDPDVRQRLSDLGQEIPPRDQLTPEALHAHQMAEIAKWWPIIKSANIKVD